VSTSSIKTIAMTNEKRIIKTGKKGNDVGTTDLRVARKEISFALLHKWKLVRGTSLTSLHRCS
jgi:hypothetical protein